jgi:hypothetical protein
MSTRPSEFLVARYASACLDFLTEAETALLPTNQDGSQQEDQDTHADQGRSEDRS